MKDSPYLPALCRISSVKTIDKNTRLIRLNVKLDSLPGQFGVLSLSGSGEMAAPIASHAKGYADFIISMKDPVSKDICKLTKGNKLGLRGPYGKGFPLKELSRRDIHMVADLASLPFVRSMLEYFLKEKKQRRKLTAYMMMPDTVLADESAAWRSKAIVHYAKDDFKLPDPASDSYLVMLADYARMDGIENYDDTQVFVTLKKDIRCGLGKCGHCVISGRYLCKDGPLFRLDAAKRMD